MTWACILQLRLAEYGMGLYIRGELWLAHCRTRLQGSWNVVTSPVADGAGMCVTVVRI
jgi:hypothetical protein